LSEFDTFRMPVVTNGKGVMEPKEIPKAAFKRHWQVRYFSEEPNGKNLPYPDDAYENVERREELSYEEHTFWDKVTRFFTGGGIVPFKVINERVLKEDTPESTAWVEVTVKDIPEEEKERLLSISEIEKIPTPEEWRNF